MYGYGSINTRDVQVLPHNLDNMQTTEYWWFVGPGATDKSYSAKQENPDHYVKSFHDNRWDGYKGQSCVIVDGLDLSDQRQIYLVKLWCSDSASFGDNPPPSKMIFISNTFCWKNLEESDRALLRPRMKVRLFGEW